MGPGFHVELLQKQQWYYSVVSFSVMPSLFLLSDSPHSEQGTIDEVDNGTEPHTSDDGETLNLNAYASQSTSWRFTNLQSVDRYNNN